MTSTETGFSSARFAITFFPAERGNSSPGGKGSIATKGIVALLAVLLLLGLGVAAQAPPESGWVSLFNEKDLTGWKKNGEEKWVVERGTILCESAANRYGHLTTEKTYRDFNLRLKLKGEAAGNSGVFFGFFNADQTPDYAYILIEKWTGKKILVALLSDEGAYRAVTLRDSFEDEMGLATQPKADLSYFTTDMDKRQTLHMQHEGIVFLVFESSASVFVWDQATNTFKQYSISD